MATDEDLARFVSRFYADPLGFVLAAYPWGQRPELSVVRLPDEYRERYPACEHGPDRWACELLDWIGCEVRARNFDGRHAVAPVRVAVASGHGVGKSAFTAWIVDWLMSTRPDSKGVITANTAQQLESKTWAEIAKWTRLCITGHWFRISAGRGSMRMQMVQRPDSWRCDAQTCREENAEAFAGLHSAASSPWYIFDEASAVPAQIWEVAEGGLTDGEPFFFCFGNPTRSSGAFFDAFHQRRDVWRNIHVDSRDVQVTNKRQIEEWARVYGEESDFFKVRVRGVFPSQSVSQFIPRSLVDGAMGRVPGEALRGQAAMVGVDVARFGDDSTVIATRVGRDATLPMKKFHGLDGVQVAHKVRDHVEDLRARGYQRVYVALDGTGVGGPVCDILNHAGYRVEEVNFGAAAQDESRYRNRRCEIWAKLKAWLEHGAIPKDEELAMDLTALEYSYDDRGRVVLERKEDLKKRGLPSPDRADALALTFACDVVEDDARVTAPITSMRPYDPFDISALYGGRR